MLGDHPFQAEVALSQVPGTMGHLLGSFGICDHVGDRSSKGLRLAYGNQPTGFTILDNGWYATSGSGYDRSAGHHCLEHYEREPLHIRWIHEDIGTCYEIDGVDAAAHEMQHVPDTFLVGFTPDSSEVARALLGTDRHDDNLRDRFSKQERCLDQRCMTLPRSDVPDMYDQRLVRFEVEFIAHATTRLLCGAKANLFVHIQ